MDFRSRAVGGVALLSLLAVASASSLMSARSASISVSGKIEGTWLTQITAVNCQTGAVLGTFSSLYSFAAGGTLSNVTTGASPALRSSGLGAWEKAGANTFKAVSMAFLFNPSGAWTGTQRIVNTFEMRTDPNELTGTISVEIFNTTETLVSTMCATLLGQRLEP